LLAQHNEVIAVDIIHKKVKLINDILSPIKDEYIKKYFKKENLNLYATLDYENAYKDVDFVVTPTNYDSDKNYFDTSAVEDVIKQVIKIKSKAIIVIKSTVPVGNTKYIREKLGFDNITLITEKCGIIKSKY
jgi:UDPglucose 6-dehydrogenase